MLNFWEAYLAGLLAIIVLMTAVWVVSVRIKNASIVDPFWSLNFLAGAAVYFALTDGEPLRRGMLAVLLIVWAVRLSAYLFWRNHGKGEDFRYQAFRQKYGPERYWWFSYFQVFLLQGVLAWLISAPLLAGFSSDRPFNWLDVAAILVWVIGFLFEAGGDFQLARFKADPANKGKLLTTGFWAYTRHPNYFGDSAVWWAYGLFSLAGGSFIPALGAVLMTVMIIRVSGVSLLEKSMAQTKPGYEDYIASTSPFFPWFKKKLNHHTQGER